MKNPTKAAIVLTRTSKAPHVMIRDSQFVGVQFDAPAIEAVKVVAEGLLETARGLGRLAFVLNASNVNIETFVRINGGPQPRPKRK